jgi:acyl-coenzyme A synthetase/AMP-(fatty) acid ligase
VRACAAVWSSGGKDGDGRIRLYVVLDSTAAGEAAEEQVRGAVSRALPKHMVPDELHTVDRLQLTDRGKIDRESLASAAPEASVTPSEGRDHG